MADHPTPCESAIDRIHKTFGPRLQALLAEIGESEGGISDEAHRRALTQINDEIAREIDALPDSALTVREMLPRRKSRLRDAKEELEVAERTLSRRLRGLDGELTAEEFDACAAELSQLRAELRTVEDELQEIEDEEQEIWRAECEQERLRGLERLASQFVMDSEKLEDLDPFGMFLRMGFVGVNMEKRKEVFDYLVAKKGGNK